MALAYGIIALISLCMVGICVLSDKKRDVWLLLVFVSVSVCNLGYFMLSFSKDLADALNSNRISYLGSVFLPFFMLMMVMRFCGMKRSTPLKVILVAVGIVMLAITTSPGILPIYYRTVDIAFVDGYAKLVRTYGPLHLLYYLYLFGYMLSMIVLTLRAIFKKKIKSRMHTVLLLCAVLCNIVIWMAEQVLPRGFELLSISYILTEALVLAIYRSMQRQGLMDRNERTQTYTINILLSVFLLLFANFLRVITKDTIEAIFVTTQIVILMIYVVILVSWGISVHDRIVSKPIRRFLMCLIGLMMLWMLLRTLRHTVFYLIFPIGQWCWYAYYIPMILIPVFCLLAAKCIGKPDEYRLPKLWYLMFLPSLVLILGILTNDLHQWAFRFHLGYEIGWDIYQHGFLFYAAVAWIFSCIALMIAEIIRRCRVPGTKKMIWMPMAMLAIAVLYGILYAVESNIFGFIEMTAALCFTVVGIWESSIKTGLIQSNTHYNQLLKFSALGVTVVDQDYAVFYRSDDAIPLEPERMKQAEAAAIMVENGIRVSGSKIRGGHSLWQEDLSQLIELLEELKELREELQDSNAVSMQNYRINKQIRSLAERNRLHDELHKQTAHQINLMNDWLKAFTETHDPAKKQQLLRRIVVVGAYLKRRNNLFLVSEQDGIIRESELSLSIEEMMKNLQFSGVTCACSVQFDRDIPSDVVMRLFDFYEYVVEKAIDGLECLLVRFFCRGSSFYCCVDAVCSLDLTGLESREISVSISDENHYTLSFKAEGGGRK